MSNWPNFSGITVYNPEVKIVYAREGQLIIDLTVETNDGTREFTFDIGGPNNTRNWVSINEYDTDTGLTITEEF